MQGYPELDEVLTHAWGMLEAGSREPQASMHTSVLATVALDGRPDARTVVLAAVTPAQRALFVNTDRRSPKHAQLVYAPYGAFAFYDPHSETQIRIRAEFRMHYDDSVARRAWEALPLSERKVYMTDVAPGQPAPRPTAGLPGTLPQRPPTEAESETLGYKNFMTLEAIATHLDWLHFTRGGSRRAAFTWSPAGAVRATWLYP